MEPHESSSCGQVGERSSLLSKSAEGATFLVALQLGSRALTFGVNQLLLRYLSPELLGISTQLEVYSISVLFFARESLRVAIQRQGDTNGKRETDSTDSRTTIKIAQKTQEIINLAYISILLGLLFAVVLGWLYLRSLGSRASTLGTPYFKEAFCLYGIGTILELLSEPCFVVVQQKSEYKIRAAAESVATILRCLVTCGAAVIAAHQKADIGGLPFAIGQWTYGLSLLFVYYRQVRMIAFADGFSLMVQAIPSSKSEIVYSYFSRPLLTLGMSLFAQGVVKHILTQGDVILVSYLAPLQAQGIYALVSNYGGLIARMIFQPIEESSRNYFGKLLSSIDAKPSKALVRSASRDLHNLLRFYLILSISAISLGPTIAPILLEFVAGSRWTAIGAGHVLARYCYYIPLLAINGVTEAFISSIATEAELNRQSAWMFAFSLGFGTAGYIFLQLADMGAEGLVWANSINLALRITWSCKFIDTFLKRNGIRLSVAEMTPKPLTMAIGFGTAAVLTQLQASFSGGIGDLVKSGISAAAFLVLIATSERHYLLQCYRSFRGERI